MPSGLTISLSDFYYILPELVLTVGALYRELGGSADSDDRATMIGHMVAAFDTLHNHGAHAP